MDRKNSVKNPDKVLYLFLCETGMLFAFLELLCTTNFKTLKEHCQRTRPTNYIRKAYIYSRSNQVGVNMQWDSIWKPINNKWLKHYETIRNTQKNK